MLLVALEMKANVELSNRLHSSKRSEGATAENVEILTDDVAYYDNDLEDSNVVLSQHATLLRNHENSTPALHAPKGTRASKEKSPLGKALHIVFLVTGPLAFLILCLAQPGKELPTAGLVFWVALSL